MEAVDQDQDQDFAERYRAVQSRDARFDGQFFTAVSSTGIYCRPSCPSRTPKPENTAFYTTSAAAHGAGYRACKRCLPEATPGTPEWDLRQDLAARAMRLIREGVMNTGGLAGLSTQLGYSQRHIRRTVTAALGAGPLALARAHRAQTARSLLVATDRSVSEIAFAAGFTSVRQFNETVREIFAASPSQIRARRRSPAAGASSTSPAQHEEPQHPLTLDLELPVRAPFDAPGVFTFLGERALSGVEIAQLESTRLVFGRTLRLPHGPAAIRLTATVEDPGWRVRMRCELTSLADASAAVAAARHLLDLDADPSAVDAALSQDETLRPLVRHRPGVRLPGTADPQEYLFRAIIGQQISVAAARTQLSRLTAAVGRPYESTIPGLTTLFPTPGEILAGVPAPPSDGAPLDPQRPLRLPARSIRTVRGSAAALEAGQLQIHRGAAPQVLTEQLTSIPGIGQWTAAYLILRVLSHPDAWMIGDVALLAGADKLDLLPPGLSTQARHRALAEHAKRWSPWRSYAAMHLWKAAEASPKGDPL